MPKWKGKYESSRKYISSWSQEFSWVTKDKSSDSAFCKICSKTVFPKKQKLQVHEQTSDHIARQKAVSNTNVNSFKKFTENKTSQKTLQIKELQLAAMIACQCHCSISAVDHLGHFMKRNGEGSDLANINVGRTKCAAMICRVISPAFKEELKEDIKDAPYSLMCDESTDISCEKVLCVLVSFFNARLERIDFRYLGLISVVNATGEALFNALKLLLHQNNMPLEKCIGFSCDGAENMTGSNNSVWSRLKVVAPFCILNKCVCHSIALTLQHASLTFPSQIMFLLQEIPAWFSHSVIRRNDFQNIFKLMNEDKLSNSPFIKHCATRWLTRGKVVNNILNNWDEFLAYFNCIVGNCDAKHRYKIRQVVNILSDSKNKLLLTFISPIISEY